MGGRRVGWPDLGLTAALVAFGLFGTGPAAVNQDQTASQLSYVLVVLAALPIVIWRWRPMWTFLVTSATTLTYVGLGFAYGPILVTMAVATYGLARRTAVRQALTLVGAAVIASVVAVAVARGTRDWTSFISIVFWLGIPAAIGVAVATGRNAATVVRAEQARRAVSEERLLLAQEVHDVVGHGLAVVALQAGVALRVLDRDPDRARAALEAIRSTSTEALDGLRAEIADLRGAPALRPRLGLADIAALAERLRSGGLPVVVDIDAQIRDLPAEINLAAYRIVRESLSNVLRHAGPQATARVHIVRTPDAVRVEIQDTGDSDGLAEASGHGIDGMRKRAQALGGTLDAGPVPGGGFAVRAYLPVPVSAARPEHRS